MKVKKNPFQNSFLLLHHLLNISDQYSDNYLINIHLYLIQLNFIKKKYPHLHTHILNKTVPELKNQSHHIFFLNSSFILFIHDKKHPQNIRLFIVT